MVTMLNMVFITLCIYSHSTNTYTWLQKRPCPCSLRWELSTCINDFIKVKLKRENPQFWDLVRQLHTTLNDTWVEENLYPPVIKEQRWMQAGIPFSQVFQTDLDMALTPEKPVEKESTLGTTTLQERWHGVQGILTPVIRRTTESEAGLWRLCWQEMQRLMPNVSKHHLAASVCGSR